MGSFGPQKRTQNARDNVLRSVSGSWVGHENKNKTNNTSETKKRGGGGGGGKKQTLKHTHTHTHKTAKHVDSKKLDKTNQKRAVFFQARRPGLLPPASGHALPGPRRLPDFSAPDAIRPKRGTPLRLVLFPVKHRVVDSLSILFNHRFFSSKTSHFPSVLGGFLEGRIPGKNGNGRYP